MALHALVTGGGQGLGREVAALLAERGYRVIVTSRAPGRVPPLPRGVTCSSQPLDLAEPGSVRSFAANLQVLDVLVNNAAAYADWDQKVTTADIAQARTVMEVNVVGVWHLTQLLMPLLRRSAAGRIVNVSSGAGSHQDPRFGMAARSGLAPAYGISKAAVNALTTSLAAELAGSGILINAVCPGLTATWPGAEKMGARPARVSAQGVVWAATLPSGGPSGGFFRDGQPLEW
ncbi:SDR family NAD(P)-dependent oxidoreductase [Hamadaea tsunoensis]|uniref:SDR family NAD(P)-dependent oxidoreductase n=1 Tax=Hamadaea tsunoensis TaxID=53368 RepID=UPI0004835283|nr:SDR family NAD(P)-dependent oxidoreductase [Hamadaea tsunoensis]